MESLGCVFVKEMSLIWIGWLSRRGGIVSRNCLVRKLVTVIYAVEVLVNFFATPTTSA